MSGVILQRRLHNRFRRSPHRGGGMRAGAASCETGQSVTGSLLHHHVVT